MIHLPIENVDAGYIIYAPEKYHRLIWVDCIEIINDSVVVTDEIGINTDRRKRLINERNFNFKLGEIVNVVGKTGTASLPMFTELSKREYFAAMAMQGMMFTLREFISRDVKETPDLSSSAIITSNINVIANFSVQVADTLLSTFEQKKEVQNG